MLKLYTMFIRILGRILSVFFGTVLLCTPTPIMSFQSVCLLRETNFIDLCMEIAKSPSYSAIDYSIKTETRSKVGLVDVYLYKDENTSDALTKRVEARGCPFIPKLFLSDDESKNYSVFVYRPVGNGLEQIDHIDNLVALGYSELDPVHPTELRNLQLVTSTSSENFIKLCEEVQRIPRFSIRYSSNSYDDLLDLKEYEVFHFDEDRRPFVDRVRARGPCETTSRLYLSNGSKNFSAFIYIFEGPKKLLRVDLAENLRMLGYDEQLEGAPIFIQNRRLESISLMSVSKFSLVCEEILQMPAFTGLHSQHLNVLEPTIDTYDIYLLPETRTHARMCPVVPELILSDGPTEHSIFVYVPGGTGIVRIDQVERLSSLSSEYASSSILLLMPESDFINLCDEVIQMSYYVSSYKMRTDHVWSRICENAKVYLLGETMIFGHVTARVCPTTPKELYLSDGPNEDSVYTYEESPVGLIRMYKLENLYNLNRKIEDQEISESSGMLSETFF